MPRSESVKPLHRQRRIADPGGDRFRGSPGGHEEVIGSCPNDVKRGGIGGPALQAGGEEIQFILQSGELEDAGEIVLVVTSRGGAADRVIIGRIELQPDPVRQILDPDRSIGESSFGVRSGWNAGQLKEVSRIIPTATM